jgi:hypothetical protein
MNAAANVGWSNDPRGARHWAHIFAPQTSHEGGTVKGRPSLTPKEPAPVLDATAYSLSAIVSKVDDKIGPDAGHRREPIEISAAISPIRSR